MKIIDDIFKKYKVIENMLIPYGFTSDGESYFLDTSIMDGSFGLNITIKDRKITGAIIDKDFNEEYTQINVEGAIGGFIAEINEECQKILIDIRKKCFEREDFISPQSNRISKKIFELYQVEPEFMWDTAPGFGVFRNKRTRKWFGIITNIDKGKIIKGESGEIEVISLNLLGLTPQYKGRKGIYEAYHLNKKNWVSILLDETLTDEEILDIISISYNFQVRKGEWLIPVNISYFDIFKTFSQQEVIIWKQSSKILPNDFVYLYISNPFSCIMFKCKVLEVDVPYEYKDENLSIKKVMRIKLIKKYERGEISFEDLKKYGIKMIRGPINIQSDDLIKLLNR